MFFFAVCHSTVTCSYVIFSREKEKILFFRWVERCLESSKHGSILFDPWNASKVVLFLGSVIRREKNVCAILYVSLLGNLM